MSWSRAVSRVTGRSAGAASTVRSVWSQRSSPGTLFWGTPRWAAELRREDGEQSGLLREPQPDRRSRRREELRELRADPLSREMGDERRVLADRGQRPGLDLELQRRGQPDRAHHPQRVLAEPGLGVAHGTQHPRIEVRQPVERIDQHVRTPPSPPRPPSGPRRSR